MNADEMKRLAAEAALVYVEDGMTVGVGTGSTAAYFIELLGEKGRNGLSVKCIPTSEATRTHALQVGLEVIEPDEMTCINVAIDGTDEVDGDFNLIKGGGGALLREKIVAQAAQKFVVIADPSKKVSQLGAFALPVEIDPALWSLTVQAVCQSLVEAGYQAEIALRGGTVGEPVFLTDGGHYVLDCSLKRISDVAQLDARLRGVPGVIETGLFIGLADVVIIGGTNGPETLTKV